LTEKYRVGQFITGQFSKPRAGSGVERLDPLRFMAGCRKG